MREKSLLQQRYADPAARRVFEQERLALEAADRFYEEMERQGLTKADVAERLGCSRAYVTQLLSGSRNMTLRTFADISWALGMRSSIELDALGDLDFAPLDVPDPRFRPRARVVALRAETTSGARLAPSEYGVNSDTSIAA